MTAGDQSALRLAALLESEIGLRAAPERLEWVAAAAQRAGQGIDDLVGALDDQGRSGPAMQRLIDEITVKESFFFRQSAQLEAIDWPKLLASARAAGRQEIRVWSAACATGDEPYTLAMLAARRLGDGAPPVSVLGTDVSAAALQQARAGRYTARAVRHVPVADLQRWLRPEGDGFVVVPALRGLVRFATHNLLDATAPAGEPPFDLVVCRNVLIYFGDRALERSAACLERALSDDGLLVLGSADRLALSARAIRPRSEAAARPRRTSGHDRRDPHRPRRPIRPQPPAEVEAVAQRDAPAATYQALHLADDRDVEGALRVARETLERDPRDAEAQFLAGMLELAAGDVEAAVASLRRALYIAPTWALAAFQLGRAHDARGDDAAARRAYRQTLASLDPDDERSAGLLGGLDLADVAAACRDRLGRESPSGRVTG